MPKIRILDTSGTIMVGITFGLFSKGIWNIDISQTGIFGTVSGPDSYITFLNFKSKLLYQGKRAYNRYACTGIC